MEARIKRLFHRKKGKFFDQALQHRQGSARETESTPNLNTHLYDSASSSGPPQIESYSSDINPARPNRKSSLSIHGQKESLNEHVPHGMIAASVLPKSRRNKRHTSQTIQPDSSASQEDKDGGYINKNTFQRRYWPLKGIGSILPHPSLYDETEASGHQYQATSKQPHLIPDGSDQMTFPRKPEPAQNKARVPVPESRSLDGPNHLRSVDNPSGISAKPGSRDDNIYSTLAETPNSRRLSNNPTSERAFEKHPQSTKGASTNEALQANHGGRPHDTFANDAQDSAAIILDRSKSTSVDTEVIETIAPGKFSILFVVCPADAKFGLHQPLSTRPSTRIFTMSAKRSSLEKFITMTYIIVFYLSLTLRCFRHAISYLLREVVWSRSLLVKYLEGPRIGLLQKQHPEYHQTTLLRRPPRASPRESFWAMKGTRKDTRLRRALKKPKKLGYTRQSWRPEGVIQARRGLSYLAMTTEEMTLLGYLILVTFLGREVWGHQPPFLLRHRRLGMPRAVSNIHQGDRPIHCVLYIWATPFSINTIRIFIIFYKIDKSKGLASLIYWPVPVVSNPYISHTSNLQRVRIIEYTHAHHERGNF